MEPILATLLGVIASWLQGYKGITKYSSYVRFLIAVLTCFIAGAIPTIASYLNEPQAVNYEELMSNIGAAFIAGQVYYNLYFKQFNLPPKK